MRSPQPVGASSTTGVDASGPAVRSAAVADDAAVRAAEDAPTLVDLAGGEPAIERLCVRFYERVFEDPLLLPLFRDPGEDHAGRLALWLTELLGGRPLHTQQRGGFAVMAGAHHGLRISEAQRTAWANHMRAAAEDIDLPDSFRRRFMPHIEGGSTFCMRVSWPKDQRGPR